MAGDQMLRSIVFIVTMNALGCRVSWHSRRGEYPDLMDADQPVVLDVFFRCQLSEVKLYEFAQERVVDRVGGQWCKVSVLAAVEGVGFDALIEGRVGNVARWPVVADNWYSP